ncbi:hypothetical protein H0H87_003203 [Tephrocybe sp. NHM501043]|nr:hypothetical protein H0H87_003203 [Tephrocybe sp. NHM501043]
MDSGAVGIIDLATKAVTRMRTKHESICGSVKFIPDRPRELVSGGYDTTLLHFDYHEGKILSTRKIPPFEAMGGMALSPPFVTSTAISSRGIIVAGTADGRLYIGYGGYKALQSKIGKKKRSRKWEGLNEDQDLILKKAEGPIVALAFDDSDVLTMSTLLGVMSRYEIEVDNEGSVIVDQLWEEGTKSVKKVNALVVDDKRVIVGGLTAEGKGVVEIWNREINYDIPIPPL